MKELKDKLTGALCWAGRKGADGTELIEVTAYFDGAYFDTDGEAHTEGFVRPVKVKQLERYLEIAKELES